MTDILTRAPKKTGIGKKEIRIETRETKSVIGTGKTGTGTGIETTTGIEIEIETGREGTETGIEITTGTGITGEKTAVVILSAT